MGSHPEQTSKRKIIPQRLSSRREIWGINTKPGTCNRYYSPGTPKHSDNSCRKGFLNAIKSGIVICLWKRKCWDVAFGLGIINQWQMDGRVDARTLYHCFVFYWSPDEPGFITPRWWRADRFFFLFKKGNDDDSSHFYGRKSVGFINT